MASLPHGLQVAVVAVFILASAVWVGGVVPLVVMARVTSGTLAPADRVKVFRGVGKRYGPIATAALLVAVGLGVVLSWGHPRDAAYWVACAATAALFVVTYAGVRQARGMTRLRRAALGDGGAPDSGRPPAGVARAARRAAALRGLIIALTLMLVVLGSVLAT